MARVQMPGDRGQSSEARGQRPEARGQRLEARGNKEAACAPTVIFSRACSNSIATSTPLLPLSSEL